MITRIVNLLDIADVQRTEKGRVYPAGTVYIQVSACKRIDAGDPFLLLERDCPLADKYAVILPKWPMAYGYLWHALNREAKRWMAKYVGSSINIQTDAFKELYLAYHFGQKEQEQVASILNDMAEECRITEAQIQAAENLKKWMTEQMMDCIEAKLKPKGD